MTPRALLFAVYIALSAGLQSGYGTQVPPLTLKFAGLNKEFTNNTGQSADGVEIVLAGTYSGVNHWDGYHPHHFTSYTEIHASGNTTLRWTNPIDDATGLAAPVPAGQIAHVGFLIPGSTVAIRAWVWLSNSNRIGCATQTGIDNRQGIVRYENNFHYCVNESKYVGNISVEWYSERVKLGDLNPHHKRHPIRRDKLSLAPIKIPPRGQRDVKLPTTPPGARYAVIVNKVSRSPRLSGSDVTTDFIEITLR